MYTPIEETNALVYAGIAAALVAVGAMLLVDGILHKKRIGVRSMLMWMFVVDFFAFLPVFWVQSGRYSIASGIIYVMQIFGMGFKYEEFITAVNAALDIRVYRIFAVILYTVSPLFAGAFVLELVANILKKFKFTVSLAKDTYIFTELNAKSLVLADSCKKWCSEVIFLGVREEDKITCSEACARKGYYILDYTPETAFKKAQNRFLRCIWMGKGSSNIYFIDTDEKLAIEKMAKFLEKVSLEKTNVKCKAYLLSVFSEAEALIDYHKEKVGIRLRLIDPAQIISYKILEECPLYAIPERNHKDGYNVTVIGMGNVGMHIAKDVIWCGQRLEGREPTVNIVDRESEEKLRGFFEYKYPELNSENYNINYFSADARSKTFDDLLANELSKSECFIICLGDDLLNAEVAREIRAKVYRCRRTYAPQIIAIIGDDEFHESVKEVYEKLRIKTVGKNSELYSKSTIENDGLLYKAWLVDCIYCEKELGSRDDFIRASDKFFKNKELDIRSNMAYAIHIDYKIYDWLGINPKEKNAYEIEKEGMRRFASDGESVDKLEHDRWNAFQRAEGLVCPFNEKDMSDEETFRAAAKELMRLTDESFASGIDYEKKKKKNDKPQRSIFSKEHGCIIDYKWIGVLGEVMFEDSDKFISYDRDTNRKIFEIRRKAGEK